LSGLSYCHKNFIAHRDIKLDNILVLKDSESKAYNCPKIKLIDFGFAVFYKKDEMGGTFCGTPSYMAPELLK
jgi:serine/threonine protein kinase